MEWINMTKEDINKMVDNMLNEIFLGIDINKLSSYEKREKIFAYLANNIKYDFEQFDIILKSHIGIAKVSRDLRQEFLDPLVNKKGICNGISQVYKLLLEKVGIYSMCVICNIVTENGVVPHQLNIVYNQDNNTFSFDDVTLAIIKGDLNEYFDYDNPENIEERQGVFPIEKFKWMVFDDDLVNYYAKRTNTLVKRPESVNEYNIYFNSMKEFSDSGINIKTSKEVEKKHQF